MINTNTENKGFIGNSNSYPHSYQQLLTTYFRSQVEHI